MVNKFFIETFVSFLNIKKAWQLGDCNFVNLEIVSHKCVLQ